MENTSCGCNCPFVKTGFCSNEKECPNYIETWWIQCESAQPKLVKDCSPKRLLLQQQLMQSRMEQMQASLCEARNEYHRLGTYLKSIVEASQKIINPKEATNVQIDSTDVHVPLIE